MLRRPGALLADPDGRRLWAAQLIAQGGASLALVALPWLVLENGGSKAVAGLTATMTVVPYVLFGLVAGVVGDRAPRRRLLLDAYLCQSVGAWTIPVWALVAGPPPIGTILASAFLVGLGRTFVDGATFGAVSEIVGREHFVQGQATMSVAFATGNIVGPFAGGALIAAIGGASTIGVQAGCFLVGAVLALRIRRPLDLVDERSRAGVVEAMREGIAAIVSVPMLRLLTGIGFLWFLAVYGTTQSLLVPYYKEELGWSAHLVGAAMGIAGVVGVGGGVAVSMLARRIGAGRLVAIGIVTSGLAVLGLAGAHGAAAALPAAALLGFSIQITLTSLVAERQRHAPNHLQSRVGVSGRAFLLGASMFGGFLASGLAAVVSLRALFAGVGVAALVLSAWAVPAIVRGLDGEGLRLAVRR